MKKIFIVTTFFFLIIVNALVIVNYAYVYPKAYFNNMNLITIISEEMNQQNEIEIVNNVANDLDVSVIAQTFSKTEDNKRLYKYYANKDIDIASYPNIFSKIEVNRLEEFKIYDPFEVNVDSTNKKTNEFIEKLNENNLTAEYTVRNKSGDFRTFEVLVMLFIIFISYIILLSIYIYSFRKRNVLYKLSGMSTFQITKLNMKKLILDIRYIVLGAFLIDIGTLIYYKAYNLQLLTYLIISIIIFVLILGLFYYEIVKTSISKNKKIISTLKNKNFSKDSYKFMLVIKTIFTLVLIVTSMNAITLIGHIQSGIKQIEKYQQYNDIIVTQTYSSLQGQGYDGMDDPLLELYRETNDKFQGVIANTGGGDGELAVNNRYFDYVDYYDIDNNKINRDSYLFENEVIYLVPESRVAEFQAYEKLNEINDKYIVSRDNQETFSMNLSELKPVGFKNQIIVVYPRNTSKLNGFDELNLASTLTRQEYYMFIEDDDPYEVLKPYLEKTGADRYIFDANHLTINKEEILQQNIEDLTYTIISLIIILSVYLIIVYFLVDTYMLINMKKLINLKLVGKSNLRLYTKIISGIMILDILVVLGFILVSNINIYLIIGIFIVDLVVTLLIYRRYMLKDFIKYMKGEL